ncbi:hypothetical protein Aph02nite_31400 [Actinoplanes philippinensis]|uniref:Major Facilitator Superfamily protein n=1 Tax=Actinoplanes philippinensis TaxID=35752 RepID=A0A1I2E9F0_9ACTN|nr:MFS transporter [Actinoplanes philippinensis]GIE77190.1 hypothetical protein Aph02nite_31400 [Actinoplanes philippinensis]SFE89111.1 Major Facilitator Superfamily protein [Actinoplanes philippinensis]
MAGTLSARVAVASNAAFYGQISVALPLTLAASGATKAQIALFFAVSALVAASLNLVAGPALRRRGSPWWGPSVCGLVAAAGALAVPVSAPSPAMYPAGAAMMTMTLIFPHYISLAGGSGTPGPARLVGRMRRIFVVGFMAGLALASAGGLVQSLGGDVGPLWIAAALALVNGLIPLAQTARRAAPEQPREPGRGLRPHGTMLTCVLAVLLLRGADSVRLVYLPLFVVGQGLSGTVVALLFLASVAAEIPLLGPITALADRIGSRRAIVLTAGVGALSFALIVAGGGVPLLIVSQLLYAVFAAGFQSVGMVLLSDVLAGDLGAGADVYTGMVQVGAVFGVVAPLLVPGYSARIFLLGAAFCVASMLLLTAIRRRLPQHGTGLLGR